MSRIPTDKEIEYVVEKIEEYKSFIQMRRNMILACKGQYSESRTGQMFGISGPAVHKIWHGIPLAG